MMDDLIGAFIALVFLVLFFSPFIAFAIGLLAIVFQTIRRNQRSDPGRLLEAARIFDGEVAQAAGTAVPFVRFTLGGIRCYFLWWNDRTIVEAKAVTDLWIEAGTRSGIWATARGKSEVNDPRFRIRTDDVWAAGQWLASGGRDFLERLPGLFRLLISPGMTSLTLERYVPPGELRDLRGMLERLLKTVESKADPGIRFEKDSFEQRGALCPVCTAALTGPFVRCRDCKTPHHRDCWTYFGRCSTFGCRGKEIE